MRPVQMRRSSETSGWCNISVRACARISVVICSFADERFGLLEKAIASVFEQGEKPFEVLVVIDHNSALMRRVSAALPDVCAMENAHGPGLSGARNTGVEAARGEVVAFLDDDAEADEDWLLHLSGHYADDAVIGVGGQVTPEWPAGAPKWMPREFYWVVGCTYRGLPEKIAPVRNPIGCNMSFRRDMLRRLGGFREEMGRRAHGAAGCEETELCIRARQAEPDATILYDPAPNVRHRISPSRVAWRYFFRRCFDEGHSKALVVNSVGRVAGLSAERDFLFRILPTGVLHGLRDATIRLDGSGLARVFAIIAGVTCVSAAYFASRLVRLTAVGRPQRPKYPVKILEIDVSSPLPDVDMRRAAGETPFRNVLCLVRRSGQALKIAEFEVDGASLPAHRLAKLVGPLPPAMAVDEAAPAQVDSPRPLLSVIVATHNRPKSLALTLDSLLIQDYPNYEIIVVDNAPSSPVSAEFIAARYAPTGRVTYVLESTPGLGRAHNKGVEVAKGAILAFTDDDTIADQKWVSSIEAAFRQDDSIGCVCGLILPLELETRAQYWTEKHGGFGKGLQRRTFDLNANRVPGRLFPYTPGEFGSGANMAFAREALNRVGGFDCALGAGTIARGGDDLAAFVAIINAGYRLAYDPAALIWHQHRREDSGIQSQAYGYGMGLGAFLTKQIVEHPAAILHFLRAFPAAIRHIFGSNSPKNRRLAVDYPRSLVWRERAGIVAGVGAYLQSRSAAARASTLAGSRLEERQ
jgi:O-antigen biosynthesis protein